MDQVVKSSVECFACEMRIERDDSTCNKLHIKIENLMYYIENNIKKVQFVLVPGTHDTVNNNNLYYVRRDKLW